MIEPLKITVNDLQPNYFVQAKDAAGTVIDLTNATIVCTMKNLSTGVLEIERQSAGITITAATNGLFNYAWQSGDTDTVGKYQIEFEVTPLGAGKYTLPMPFEAPAIVEIISSQDTS